MTGQRTFRRAATHDCSATTRTRTDETGSPVARVRTCSAGRRTRRFTTHTPGSISGGKALTSSGRRGPACHRARACVDHRARAFTVWGTYSWLLHLRRCCTSSGSCSATVCDWATGAVGERTCAAFCAASSVQLVCRTTRTRNKTRRMTTSCASGIASGSAGVEIANGDRRNWFISQLRQRIRLIWHRQLRTRRGRKNCRKL